MQRVHISGAKQQERNKKYAQIHNQILFSIIHIWLHERKRDEEDDIDERGFQLLSIRVCSTCAYVLTVAFACGGFIREQVV